MRRIILVVALSLIVAAMMVVSAMPAFAGPKSQNSCGASNLNIEVPPGQGENRGDEFDDCGFRNNKHGVPPGHTV
jgi:hypothetical protein